MFTHYRSTGFVLKKQDIREADQLFSVFTKDFGRVEVLGRSIRKIESKLRPHIEIFYLTEIEFVQGRTYKILTDAILIDKFSNLRQNLKGLTFAHKIAFVFDKLIKGQEQDLKLWQLLTETFDKLNSQRFIYHDFLWQFLTVLGYNPEHLIEKDKNSFVKSLIS